jgi:diguanylate cyclase (GGDEF)-like protein
MRVSKSALWSGALLCVLLLCGDVVGADTEVQNLVDRAEDLNVTAPWQETRAFLESINDRLEAGSDAQRHQIALISARLHVLAANYQSAISEIEALLDEELEDAHRLRALELAATSAMLDFDFQTGFIYLNKALQAQTSVDDLSLRAGVMGLAAYWHAQLGDREKGLIYARQSLDIAKQSGMPRNICVAQEKLGQAEEMAGLHNEALDTYRAGIDACVQANDPVFIGVMKVLTGRLLHRMGRSEEAEPWLREGLVDTEHAGFEDGVLDGKLNYAELLYDQGRFDEARALLEPIIETLRRHDRQAKLADAYALMAGLKTQAGEHARAYNYLRDHLSLREQVLDSERTRLIAFYEVEFDAINREQELALLREQARVASLQEATARQQRRLRQMGLLIGILLLIGLSLLLVHALRERRHFRQLSQTDPLTGLSNHTRFFEQAEQLVAQQGQDHRHRPLTLVMADLDHFKQVNDQYGHLVGDEILRSASAAFRRALGEHGTLGRIGGEEFAACLPNQGTGAARRHLEDLRRRLNERLGQRLDRPVTMSFGLAELIPGEGLDSLRSRADQALYKAKHLGRDRAEVAPANENPSNHADRP